MTNTIRHVPGQLPSFPGATVHLGLIHTSGIVDDLALRGTRRSGAEQIDWALDVLISTVELAGGTAATILRVEAYLVSPDDLSAWGAAFEKRWPYDAPARTTLITQLALPTLTVEIQAVAAVDEPNHRHLGDCPVTD